MYWTSLAATAALIAPSQALLRFGCSQLVVERLDPLVNPGVVGTPHLHQIIGGNSFNATMDPAKDMPNESTCTTCQFTEDLSNYWTAVLFFKSRNGTFKRLPQIGNAGFDGQRGGMTVYYMQNGLAITQQTAKVTAFKPGFRMLIGDSNARSLSEAMKYRQVTYTCLQTPGTRYPETKHLPTKPCPAGIMSNTRFPTCWNGKDLDSPNHMDHMAYPETGTFEAQGPCPASHPVKVPQLMYEVIWDTKAFNNPNDWPEDPNEQPFVWSMDDTTGFGSHGDYMFGWKDDSLQKAMDTNCYVNCPSLKTQSMARMNACSQKTVVNEDVDGWLSALPGHAMPDDEDK